MFRVSVTDVQKWPNQPPWWVPTGWYYVANVTIPLRKIMYVHDARYIHENNDCIARIG